jgi:hypothetical protein
MDDARIAVETGVDGVDVVIGTSSYLREHSHGKGKKGLHSDEAATYANCIIRYDIYSKYCY